MRTLRENRERMRTMLRVAELEESCSNLDQSAKRAMTEFNRLADENGELRSKLKDRHDFGVKAPSYQVLKRNCMGVGTVKQPCWGPVEWSDKYERPLCQGHNEPGYKPEEGPCL